MCSLRIVFQVSFNWRGVKPNLQNNQGQDTKDAFFKYSSINLKNYNFKTVISGDVAFL
jgi:hypothetical protein